MTFSNVTFREVVESLTFRREAEAGRARGSPAQQGAAWRELGQGARAGGDETCPISTEGWTRRVQLVREGGGGGGKRRGARGAGTSAGAGGEWLQWLQRARAATEGEGEGAGAAAGLSS